MCGLPSPRPFVLDLGDVTRTKALGTERIERKLRYALPGGDGALRALVWEFMRPMLSPALVELNRDAFVVDESAETTVDLEGHRPSSDLDELVLDDEPESEGDQGAVAPLTSSHPAGWEDPASVGASLSFCPRGRSST